MPKFTRKGPNVPDELVQALEEDRVALFCGAGVSMGAGLPDFAGLVSQCCVELTHNLPVKKSAESAWPDRMLGTLESKFGTSAVRDSVAKLLDKPPTDLSTHKAILQLARLRGADGLRLVTTNFDTFFEQALDDDLATGLVHTGPILPIPRDDRIKSWRSIAYLHGRLGDEVNNHQLVLTSADFGRAYLTEGWATRFVSRLFADFTVLFIGYSLNDPVLRYLTDAFAAEAALSHRGDQRGPSHIFLDYNAKSGRDPQPWRDRGLEPIFFHKERNFLRLRETLIEWAEFRSDWTIKTKKLVSRIAPSRPEAIGPSDSSILVWAVIGGHPIPALGANCFSELPVPPPIAWLKTFENSEDAKLKDWNQAREKASANKIAPPPRPTLYVEPLTYSGAPSSQLDKVSVHLVDWLVKHLASTEFVAWALEKNERGLRLHPRLRMAIREVLNKDQLTPGFKRIWSVLSAEGAWTHSNVLDGMFWSIRRPKDANSESLITRQELLALLRPYVHLSRSYNQRMQDEVKTDGTAEPTFDALANVDIRLVVGDELIWLGRDIDKLSNADDFIADLVEDLAHLVKSILDLWRMFDRADRSFDPTSYARQSIVPHKQNWENAIWSLLIDWIWRGWCRIDERDRVASRALMESWRIYDYFIFQRLRLAAMTKSENYTDDERIEALLNGDVPPIWITQARKEVFDLVERLGVKGNDASRSRLSAALLAGPPREFWSEGDETQRLTFRDRMIFDRISWLERFSEPVLSQDLVALLTEIRQKNPEWKLPEGEQARFNSWMEVKDVVDYVPHFERLMNASTSRKIVSDLLKNFDAKGDQFNALTDAWRRVASEKPLKALLVLKRFVGQEDSGPPDLWRATLWGLRDKVNEKVNPRKSDATVLNPLLGLVLRCPAEHFRETTFSRAVAELLQSGAQNAKAPMPDDFWEVFDLTLVAAQLDPYNQESPNDRQWVNQAINRSMGYLASAFFSGLFALSLKAGDGIPEEHIARLNKLIGLGEVSHRSARVIAASRLPYLFAIDPDWATNNIIPLLDWEHEPDEALPAWQGFAWNPRVTKDLWVLIKDSFLSAFNAQRLEGLGESSTPMAQIVMLAGVEFGLAPDQACKAIRSMTEAMRSDALIWLWNDLLRSDSDRSDGGRADDRWRTKVRTWLSKAWPKDQDLKTAKVGQQFALLPTSLDTEFPSAVQFVLPFVVRGDGSFFLDSLKKGEYGRKYPDEALQLLRAGIPRDLTFLANDVRAILKQVDQVRPSSRDSSNYKWVSDQIVPFEGA